MLNWLQEILGEAYTAEIDEKVRMEIGKAFVSKSDFAAKNEAVRELTRKLAEKEAELKQVDAENLQGEIGRLQEALSEARQESALKEALSGYRFSSGYAKEGILRELAAKGLGKADDEPGALSAAIEALAAQKPDAFFRDDLPRFSRTEKGRAGDVGMQFHFTAVK
ncbi:MAG: hypothetical protein IJO50_02240 [Clostridia bacterium]|nr:hypothetical protein [Clostridia bacterium]